MDSASRLSFPVSKGVGSTTEQWRETFPREPKELYHILLQNQRFLALFTRLGCLQLLRYQQRCAIVLGSIHLIQSRDIPGI